MGYTEGYSEKLGIVGYVSTSHGFAGTSKASATIDMDIFQRALIIVQGKATSTVSTTHGGLTIGVYDATNTGKCASTAIMTSSVGLTLATTTRAYFEVFEVTSEMLGKKTTRPGTGRFMRVRLVGTTLKRIGNVIILGGSARYGPASQYDLANVLEVEDDMDD